jgi:hypothetical protein
MVAGVLCFAACKKDPTGTSDESAGPGPSPTTAQGRETTPPASQFDRITRAELAPFGRQPGFVADGLAYAAIRPDTAVTWLRKIPMPPDAARELADLARETGVDWRAEDLQRRFALAPGAVISMTLFRPITTDATRVRGELARGGIVLHAMNRVWPEFSGDAAIAAPPPTELPPAVDPLPIEEKIPIAVAPGAPEDPKPISPPPDPLVPTEIESPPEPRPIAPETLDDARDALRRASGLGLHSRVVIPVSDAEPLLQWMRPLVPARALARVAALCPSLPQARLCLADDEIVAIVRSDASSVTIDIVVFVVETRELGEAQQGAVRAAIELRPIEGGRATELRGDAAIELEAGAIVALAAVDGIRRALSGIRWGDTAIDDTIRAKLDGIDAIERLASAPLLFTGVRLEAGIGDADRLQAELRWLAPADRRADNDALLGSIAAHASVPSYDGLCDGAVICARTRGVPKPSLLSDRLATGAWAVGPDEFERTFERNDEIAALHVVAASWPNLLGAAARWPALEAGQGPEGAMVRNLVDVVGRIEGFGGSVRSFSIGSRAVQADYVLYARTTAQDSGIVRGFLSIAGQSMNEITLAKLTGPTYSWTIPEDDVPATVISRADPPGPTGAPAELGWIALVDGADRMGWLLGLPQETPDGPPAYAEIPDLARALPSVPEIERELGFLRGFLGGLRLRAMLDVDAGEPRVTAVLSRGAP